MKKILVIGSFMTDLVAVTKRAPIAGETIIGKSFAKFTGGKGANQAVTAARLGAEVTMIGKLGRDTLGEEHLEALKQDGINHEHVLFDDEASTGVGHIVLEESGNNRIIVIPGANLALTPEEIESFESVIAETDILILQLEIPFDSIYKAIELAHKHNKTIFLNPAPAADLDPKYVGLVDFIIPNESEAQTMEETLLACIYVIDNINRLGLPLKSMTAEEIDFIKNWESEAYRKSLVKSLKK